MEKLVVLCCVFAFAAAQYGFYDLSDDESTKLKGTTSKILPNCMSIPSGMCGDGGRTIYAPDARIPNLIGWYTFDDSLGLDHSGNANHPELPPPAVGPGYDGHGQSVYFDANTYFKVDHSPAYDGLRQMTVSFWIYLLVDSNDGWRVLFHKGDNPKDNTPSLLLHTDARRLHAMVSTSDPSKKGLDSVTAIPLRRWTHVAMVLNYNVISLFINGIKDSEGMVTGDVQLNSGAWYFGKDKVKPGTGMFMDNLKIYSHPMDEKSLQMEASSALPGLGPNFLRLGCKACQMKTAIEECAKTGGYHLCRKLELQGGGLMVARAMGYLDMATEQWTAEDEQTEVNLEKLGLCCLD